MKIEIQILNKDVYPHYRHLPQYATEGSVGMDIRCAESIILPPGGTKMVPTGVALWIASDSNYSLNYHTLSREGPSNGCLKEAVGIAGLIIPRSGLGMEGLILANTVGLIDEDYQGELKIAAWNRNHSEVFRDKHQKLIQLNAGDRIAQLVLFPVIKAEWNVVEEFSNNTDRGEGGFGSTGK